MEVLDIFGSTVTEKYKPPEQCFNRSLNTSPDFWHKYAEGFYVYSAFKVSNEKDWSMNSIAIIAKHSQSSALMKESLCALITGDPTEEKFEGTIEWKEIFKNDVFTTYSLTCNVPEIRGNSHLFSLYDTKSNQLNFPLHLSPESKDNEASLCVISNEPYWKPSELIKFIHYYSQLGIDNFYLYHRGVSDQVISTLEQFAPEDRNVAIHLLTWNLPFSQSTVDLSLLQLACDLRQNDKTTAVSLQMGHYLVTWAEFTVADFVKRQSQGPESIYEADLSIQSVCSNISTPKNFQLVKNNFQLVKNTETKQSSARVRWTRSRHTNHLETIKIQSKTAKMFVFEPCSMSSSDKVDDDDPLLSKFSKLVHFVTKM